MARCGGPDSSGGDDSFVSGHATAAFSTATIIASAYNDSAVIPPLAYDLATLTAFSRVNDNEHWTSDVVFGAALGYVIGRPVYLTSPFRRRNGNIFIEPVARRQMAGLRLRVYFW